MSTSTVRKWLWAAAGFMLALVVVSVVWLLAASTVNTSDTKDTATDIKDLAETIEDCTKPGGECYKRAREQRLQTVFDINKVSVYGAYCAQKVPNQSLIKIQTCIIKELEKDENNEAIEGLTH
jgi:hypothetical protein